MSTEAPTKVTECPICLESPMAVPIYQCFEGHVLCSSCENRLNDCPACRMPLPKDRKIRNRVLEDLQPDMPTPRASCPSQQCPALFHNATDLQHHLLHGCVYRKVPLCQLLAIDHEPCNQQFSAVEAKEAAAHLVTCHGHHCKMLAPREPQNAMRTGSFRFFVWNSRLVVLEFLNFEGTQMLKIKPFILAPQSEASKFKVQLSSWTWHDYGLRTLEQVMKNHNSRRSESVGPMWSLVEFCNSGGCGGSPSIHIGTDTSKCVFMYEIVLE